MSTLNIGEKNPVWLGVALEFRLEHGLSELEFSQALHKGRHCCASPTICLAVPPSIPRLGYF